MTELEILNAIIKDNNLSQKDLAMRLGVSKQFINQILSKNSNKKISSNLLSKIKECFPKYFNDTHKEKLVIPDIVDKKFLETFRNYYGFSQNKLAQYLGISQTYYSQIVHTEKVLTDSVIERLKLLNKNPDKKIDVSLVEKNQPVLVDYYASLEDFESKHARRLYIDKLLLKDRDISECNIITLKIDSNHESFKILIDTSSTVIQDAKKYLIKTEDKFNIYSISIKKNKIKCTSIFSNKDTFYFDSDRDIFGEFMGIFTV